MCLREITNDEDVDVSITSESGYKSHTYCHACFLDRKNWKKIHIIPDKQFSRSYGNTKNI